MGMNVPTIYSLLLKLPLLSGVWIALLWLQIDTLDPSREPDHLFVFFTSKSSGTSETRVFDERSPSGNDYLAEVGHSIIYYILILILRWMKSRIFLGIMYKYHNSITLDQVNYDIIALSSCFRFTILNCKTRIASN